MAKEDKGQAWDSHDLEANLVVQLNRLSGHKKYKIANVKFLNPRTRSVVNGADESFGDLLVLRPGGVYTKKDFVEQLETLSSSDCFAKIELEAKTNPDGSLDINIPFRENIYPSKTLFRCICFGSLPEEKSIEMDPEMTEKEKLELMRRSMKQYRKRIESSRECIFPGEMQEEIQWMMRQRPSLSAGFLRRIARKIQKWYNDNAYDGAFVCGHSNPEANQGGEIVYEVVEGDITELAIRFVDRLGNICEGKTNPGVINRVLPEQVAPHFEENL